MQAINRLPTSVLFSFILELNFSRVSCAHGHSARDYISQPSVRTSSGL